MTHDELKELLDSEAARINSPAFIADDPVRFPRRFTDLRDIEITALLAATLAWGNRKMICRDCERMLTQMDGEPYHYMMDCGYEDLPPELNIHRTFFARDLAHYLRGLRRIYSTHGSLQQFARNIGIQASETPSWTLVEAMNRELAEANNRETNTRCLPQNLESTALKRINMALRWLVRNDGIVDMGVWDVITPDRLYIPLDVHVGNVARELGMLSRRANDRKAVIELTDKLRQMRPDDPIVYDFALFGIGMNL